MEELAALPGIGPKSAERIAFHILRLSAEDALKLARAVENVKLRLKQCSACFNLSDTDPCHICSDPRRDHSVICVVEQPRDLLTIERAARYRGDYHVLGGHIAPLDGIEAEHLTIARLAERVKDGGIREVIIATNPTLEGDATALEISNRLRDSGIKVTRIARGIPSGSQIEYASNSILTDALDGRREM